MEIFRNHFGGEEDKEELVWVRRKEKQGNVFHFAVSKPTYFHLLTGVRSPTEPTCKVVENEQDNTSVTKRKRSLANC